MGKIIDIDLYRDGFDSKTVNCIHNPLAAASGSFERKNYFAYCFLYEIIISYCDINYSFVELTNRILSKLGLRLNVIDIENCDTYTILDLIKKELDQSNPVFIGCKYNSLFYNSYYKNPNFKYTHGLIVSGYNDDSSTFIINDSSLVRNLFLDSENSDLYFPLQVEGRSILDIINYSDKQLQEEIPYFRIFSKHFFSVSKVDEMESDYSDIIKKGLNIMTSSDSIMIKDIDRYDPNNEGSELTYDLEDYIRIFIGSLKPIFKMLSLHVGENKELLKKIYVLNKNIEKKRRAVISRFIKFVMQKKSIPDEMKNEMMVEWKKADSFLIDLIREFADINNACLNAIYYVDISDHYNNQAFAPSISNDSKADITGEGTHFLFQNVLTDSVWKRNDFQFIYKCVSDFDDNISCKGQMITLSNNFHTDRIAFLGCSEYGSYQEKFIITYDDNSTFELQCDFSDFFQLPIYNENIFWSGMALDRKDSKTTVHNFNSRLFAKRYNIPEGVIKSIEFPKRKNIHIFAITLEHK